MRKVVRFVSLLLERLRLPDPDLDSLDCVLAGHTCRIEFRPEGRKFTRKGVCPTSLLGKRLCLLDLRRFSAWLRRIELGPEGRAGRTCKRLSPASETVDRLWIAFENLPLEGVRSGNLQERRGFVADGVRREEFASIFDRRHQSLRLDCAFTA
jgi:hypothetical protein